MPLRVVSWLAERAADYGNVRAALEWGAASEPCVALRLLVETKDLFFMLGQADGRRLAELVLQQCPERNRYRAEATIAADDVPPSGGEVISGVFIVGIITTGCTSSIRRTLDT